MFVRDFNRRLGLRTRVLAGPRYVGEDVACAMLSMLAWIGRIESELIET